MFGFAGYIALITDPKMACDIMMNDNLVKVISLDEENAVPMLCDENNPQAVPGTQLLPPVEAMWAIIDEKPDEFAQIYYAHLITPECMQFVASVIAAAYQGGHIIFYYPSDNDMVINYLYNYFKVYYGMTLGTGNGIAFMYDQASVPLYCNSIYSLHAMSNYEYLMHYPVDAAIPEQIYFEIIKTGLIPGDNLAEKMGMVDKLRRMLKINPMARCPILEGGTCY